MENCLQRVNWTIQTVGKKQLSLSEGRGKKKGGIWLWVMQLRPNSRKSPVYEEPSPIVTKLMTARAICNNVCTCHCMLDSLKNSATGCLSPSVLVPSLLPYHLLYYSPSRKPEWADQEIQSQELGWNRVLISEDWKLWNQNSVSRRLRTSMCSLSLLLPIPTEH